MALKTRLLSVAFLALQISKPVWCAVGDACTSGGNECAATEKCVSDKCADRTACNKATDCSDKGACEDDHSCTCDAGYTGNDCSTECEPVCVNGKCKLEGTDPVCDCTGTGFGGETCNKECDPVCVNGECKLEGTEPVCDCTGTGFGGETCNKANGGNSVAATPGAFLAVLLAVINL